MARYTKGGDVVRVPQINAELEKIEQAFENTLSRDGDAPNQMNAPIDMNGNKIVNVQTDITDPNSLVQRADLYLKSEVDAKDTSTLQEAKAYADAINTFEETVDAALLRTQLADVDSTVLVGGVEAKDILKSFDNVEEMKLFSAPVGSKLHCARYHATEDVVEGLIYEVRAPLGVDGFADHVLANGNEAILLTKETKASQCGAHFDGTDSADALTAMMSRCIQYDSVLQLDGRVSYASTITVPDSLSIVGNREAVRQTGSVLSDSAFIWTGGAAPMMELNKPWCVFKGFSVENQGTATCWLNLTSGSIGQTFDSLYFIKGNNHTLFSEATIKSNGVRLGYSTFKRLQVKTPSIVFLEINNAGSTLGMTPMEICDRCIFESVGFDLVLIKVIEATLESISCNGCTFNTQGDTQITFLDTRTDPTPTAVQVLEFVNNEIDIAAGGTKDTRRFMRLSNVENITFDNNQILGGGVQSALVDLFNSNVVSCEGNYFRSCAGPLFNAVTDSKVAAGLNYPDTSNTEGIANQLESINTHTVTASGSTVLDGLDVDARSVGMFIVEVDSNATYRIRASTAKPRYFHVGQVFTVSVRNVSGVAIPDPLFDVGFTAQSFVGLAPADGEQLNTMFMWNGTSAVQISSPVTLPI